MFLNLLILVVDTMKVKFSYLEEQFKNPEPIFNDIKKLVKSGDFTLGKDVFEFNGLSMDVTRR